MAIYQDEITCIEECSSSCTPRRKGRNVPVYKEKGKCYTSYQFYPSLSRQWLYKLWSGPINGMELMHLFLKPFLWFATIFISLLLDPDAEYLGMNKNGASLPSWGLHSSGLQWLDPGWEEHKQVGFTVTTRHGSGYPPQCSCLENSMGWGAWWAAVQGVTKNQTWLSD